MWDGNRRYTSLGAIWAWVKIAPMWDGNIISEMGWVLAIEGKNRTNVGWKLRLSFTVRTSVLVKIAPMWDGNPLPTLAPSDRRGR